MAKKYELLQDEVQMLNEPVVAYRHDVTSHLHAKETMPCTYSDEEFKEEVALSEASGFVSNEEFKRSCLEKWGVAL